MALRTLKYFFIFASTFSLFFQTSLQAQCGPNFLGWGSYYGGCGSASRDTLLVPGLVALSVAGGALAGYGAAQTKEGDRGCTGKTGPIGPCGCPGKPGAGGLFFNRGNTPLIFEFSNETIEGAQTWMGLVVGPNEFIQTTGLLSNSNPTQSLVFAPNGANALQGTYHIVFFADTVLPMQDPGTFTCSVQTPSSEITVFTASSDFFTAANDQETFEFTNSVTIVP